MAKRSPRRDLYAAAVRTSPIPIPGYGQWVQGRVAQRPDDSINPRQAYGPRPQQAPYKRGQTATRKRRSRPTRPYPGPHAPTVN